MGSRLICVQVGNDTAVLKSLFAYEIAAATGRMPCFSITDCSTS